MDKETFVKMSDRISYIRNQIRTISHNLMEPYSDNNSENLVDLIKTCLIDYSYLIPTINFEFNHFPEFINKDKYDSSQVLIIIKELVNNAINHSFSDNIDVNITEHDQNLTIIIEDNGIGFDKREVKNGIGLRNLSTRIEQLNGSFIIESSKGIGSTFIIELSKKEG